MRRRTAFMPWGLLLILAILAGCGGAAATSTPPVATVVAGATRTTTGVAATAPTTATRTSTTAVTTATAARGTTTAAAPAPRVTGNVTVFAAASLTDAFNEIKAGIERANPGTTIAYNFGASSTLRTQLEQGARADVYASADTAQMDAAKRANLIQGDARIFVRNTPVVIVPADNRANIAGPQNLARPGVKLVLTGAQVPIGNYARQIFERMAADPAFGPDFNRRVQANVASEEQNVRAVVAKVQLGEGDAGIVYSSDVTPQVRAQVRIIPIPAAFNIVAEYPIAGVRGGGNAAGARAFIAWILSAEGQAILERNGFIPVGQPSGGAFPGTTGATGWHNTRQGE